MRRRDLGASSLCQLYHRGASYLEIILRSLPQVTAAQPLQSGAEGDRTLNLSIANAALSQLSYRPGRWVILHQSNLENASTQAKMKGVAAVQHGPDTGLVHPRGSTNQERTTHDRKSICAPARPLWPWPSGSPFWPAQPQPARAKEAPFGLVDWKPIADNPVFAGTGSNTWDRKIRERGSILIGTGRRRDLPPLVHRVRSRPTGHNVTWAMRRRAMERTGLATRHNPIFTDSWVEDMCIVKYKMR